MELTKVNPQEFGLEVSQAETIEQAFMPKIIERDGYAVIYSDLISKEIDQKVCAEASDLRKKLVKVRTGIADIHKTQKAFFLAAGRFVDAWKNKETLPIEQMESTLQNIENYYINIEKEKAAKLKEERIARLSEVSDNTDLFQVELMTDAAFEALIEGQKLAKEARVKAEHEAEKARLAAIEAEKAEQERIRKENEALKAEAEAKEKQLESERKEAADKLKAEQDAAEAARLKAQAEAEAILKTEREEREKVERELKAKQVAELAAKQEAEKIEAARIEAEKKAAKAPDKDKLKSFVSSIVLPVFPELKTPESKHKAADISAKFEAFKSWAISQIESI